MKAPVSTDDPALAAWLGSLQEASFSRAGGAVRKAYPPERRMTGPQLAGYLAPRTYALASSTRRYGRPHAADAVLHPSGPADLPGTAGFTRLSDQARRSSRSSGAGSDRDVRSYMLCG